MDKKEEKYLEDKVQECAELFCDELKKNRDFTKEQMDELKSGRVYSGKQAKELNLVDSFGREREVFDLAKKLGNLEEVRKKYAFLPPPMFMPFGA